MQRYSQGFKRGLHYGRDLFKGKVIRWLRARHVVAKSFAAQTPDSEYWAARAHLLEQLMREVEDL